MKATAKLLGYAGYLSCIKGRYNLSIRVFNEAYIDVF